ncbi:3-ketoacyl-(acyl-carrier-protein) reductase [Streptomyces bingchenggensis BCW-1]|uniref:3-ketoacyl-(Acyl-carrier-protein) reductase n=1 Tax=Streptomyces bingchenggensis (strain BCW-1) TaxID=749414 RepID=D7BSD1_STRBB|nr:3-ketoacyl-(acyl-carrier-protein) reductase [Streptomyces bingchenggensis BCW-1]
MVSATGGPGGPGSGTGGPGGAAGAATPEGGPGGGPATLAGRAALVGPAALAGRAALVTGASRGIGLAVAEALTEAGAAVCVTARDPDGLADAVRRLGPRAIACPGDVADPAHLDEAVSRALSAFGRLDILVNNAATNAPLGPLMDADPLVWRAAFTVNVEAPLRLTQAAWRGWMREHGGAIVNICTEGTHGVGPGIGAYGASKTALLRLTRQLAAELAPYVRVNAVSPGLVRTEMARFVWESDEPALAAALPLGRIGEPDDVARAVRWLLSDEASWITGTDLVVDGGRRVRAALRPA